MLGSFPEGGVSLRFGKDFEEGGVRGLPEPDDRFLYMFSLEHRQRP